MMNTTQWTTQIGKLFGCIDQSDFPHHLVDTLERFIDFDMAALFVYSGRSRPICLYDTFPDPHCKSGLRNYINGTYVLNPFYHAHLSGIDAGVYRITDLTSDSFTQAAPPEMFQVKITKSEEIGFVTKGWPTGLEELNIAVPLEHQTTVEISLCRSALNGGFQEQDIVALKQGLPIFCEAFRKYWSLRHEKETNASYVPPLNDLFNQFGQAVLTDREQQVIQYVLKGHSSESISYNLDISVTTVKTHRKRAYAKLNISSQSELMSKFLNSLECFLQ